MAEQGAVEEREVIEEITVDDDTLETEQVEVEPTEEVKEAETEESIVDVDGEKVPVSELKEWKKSHDNAKNMLADYTRKTQALAAERRKLELATRQYEEPAIQPAQRVEQPIEKMEFTTPVEERLYSELQEVKGTLGVVLKRQETTDKMALRKQVDDAIDGFAKSHPGIDEQTVDKVLEIANDMKAYPSKEAFDRIYAGMQDPETIKRQAVEEYKQGLKKKAPAQLLKPKTVGVKGAAPDVSKLSDREWEHSAVNFWKEGGES